MYIKPQVPVFMYIVLYNVKCTHVYIEKQNVDIFCQTLFSLFLQQVYEEKRSGPHQENIILPSSHPILTSSPLPLFPSSHPYIFPSLHLPVLPSSPPDIFPSCHPPLLTSSGALQELNPSLIPYHPSTRQSSPLPICHPPILTCSHPDIFPSCHHPLLTSSGALQLSVGPPLGRTYAAPAVCWGGGRNPPLPCLDLGR
jgi:hypothetical protein